MKPDLTQETRVLPHRRSTVTCLSFTTRELNQAVVCTTEHRHIWDHEAASCLTWWLSHLFSNKVSHTELTQSHSTLTGPLDRSVAATVTTLWVVQSKHSLSETPLVLPGPGLHTKCHITPCGGEIHLTRPLRHTYRTLLYLSSYSPHTWSPVTPDIRSHEYL